MNLSQLTAHRVTTFGMLVAVVGVGCSTSDSQGGLVVPSYDVFTSRLISLSADQNGDGQLDQWTYLDGNRPLRGEADQDGDGRIDRWEYFGPQAELRHVGSSSLNDGVEDTWTWPAVGGESRVDRSRRRDRQVDRKEFYQGRALVRAEDDTNGDGRTDKWDQHENGVLRVVGFDTTLSRGRQDYRLLYDAQGHYAATEADPDGDGRFEPVTARPPVRPPGELR